MPPNPFGGTDRVKIVLEDGTAYPQEGSLQFRDVTVDPSTGSVILRIVVPNRTHEQQHRPGAVGSHPALQQVSVNRGFLDGCQHDPH